MSGNVYIQPRCNYKSVPQTYITMIPDDKTAKLEISKRVAGGNTVVTDTIVPDLDDNGDPAIVPVTVMAYQNDLVLLLSGTNCSFVVE